MARLIQRYWDIPDGTECHRKAYASTSITGAVGEHRLAGPGGGGCREVIGSLGAVRGWPGGLCVSRGGIWFSSGCLGIPCTR